MAASACKAPNDGQCVLTPVSNPTQSATNLILRRDTDGQACASRRPSFVPKTQMGAHSAKRRDSRRRSGDRHKAYCRAALGIALRCAIGTPLADTETRLRPGAMRRFGDCGKSCGRLRQHLAAAFDVTTKNSKRREFS